MTISAYTGSLNETKVAFAEDASATTTRTVVWKTGDEISIFNASGTKVTGTLSSGQETSCGEFTSAAIETAAALYPAQDGATYSEGVITFSLPKGQEYVAANTFGSKANVAVAKYAESKLSFKNLCSVVKISVTAPFSVDRVDLVDLNDDALWGTATASVESGTITGITNSADDKNVVSLISASPIDITSGGTFFFVVPAGTLTAGYKVILYHNNIPAASLTNSTANTTERATVHAMNAATATKYNLSLEGNANCYIAPVASITYKFKTYEGNSETPVEPASVAVAWETVGTSTAPTVGDVITGLTYADGAISFQRTANNGNALIVAKDGSDNILWSWHIWCSPDVDYVANAQTYGSYKLMDRNVGALVAANDNPLASGLIYQWGRKDPFMGAAALNANTQAVATASFNTVSVAIDHNNGTIAYATAHPTTFITPITSKSADANGDWYYTGTTTSDETRWGSTKTKYDPCPAGWQVPPQSLENSWNNSAKYPNAGIIEVDGTFGRVVRSSPKDPEIDLWTYSPGPYHDAYPGDSFKYWSLNNGAQTTNCEGRPAYGMYVRCQRIPL